MILRQEDWVSNLGGDGDGWTVLMEWMFSVRDDQVYALDRWFDGIDYSNVFSKVRNSFRDYIWAFYMQWIVDFEEYRKEDDVK